jgi:hypothetical protein
MSFLHSNPHAAPVSYRTLGYARNPFPVRAEVRRQVFVDRPEVSRAQREFEAFVLRGGAGAMWAIEADSGVGKSNLLQHIALDLELQTAGPAIVHRYITAQLVRPRNLQREVTCAIGQKLLAEWLDLSPKLPTHLIETNLGRFVDATAHSLLSRGEAAPILARWLSGEQTRADERRRFGIHTREQLEPGSALPYLRAIVDGLVKAGKLGGLVLLLDEQEDTMVLAKGDRNAYLMALKGLVNAFNFQHLFVFMTGTPGVFASLGQEHVSLASRWKIAKLLPVQDSGYAWALALAHMRFEAPDEPEGALKPDREKVEAMFGRLAGGRGWVTQRDLLDALHQWVEDEASRLATPTAHGPAARARRPNAPPR